MKTHWLLAIILAMLLAAPGSGEEEQGLFLHVVEGEVRVEPLEIAQGLRDGSRGLAVWSERGVDRWRFTRSPRDLDRSDNSPGLAGRLASGTRALSDVAGSPQLLATPSLDQILGQVVMRGRGFLTPRPASRLLEGKFTLRRLPERQGEPFPQDTATLSSGNQKLFDFPLAQGTERVRWSEIAGLPEPWRDGLPAGTYTLRVASGGDSATFTVEDADTREWILYRSTLMAGLLGTDDHPLHRLVTLEEMLGAVDQEGRPSPYLADALDLIESLPEEARSSHLKKLHQSIAARLRGQLVPPTLPDPTGIEVVDAARLLIEHQRWSEALQLLRPVLQDAPSPRAAGLAHLYTAVVLAESAAAGPAADKAEAHFQQALAQLADAPASDRFRAHNNYANFLLVGAQDRLYNFSFQAATGVRNPLLEALQRWQGARDHYTTALQLAAGFSPHQQAAVEVNLARTHVLLADLLRTLAQDDSAIGTLQITQVEQLASTLLTAALTHQPDPLTRGALAENLAHLAFRQGDYHAASEALRTALDAYYDAGYLAGAETCYRVLGMVSLRQADQDADPQGTDTALQQLLTSQLLTEILRERLAADQSGVTRAGFFARRAQVGKLIVQRLLERGEAARALKFAEHGKARALQDLLTAGGIEPTGARGAGTPPVDQVLEDWPEGVVALEYFLGNEQSWVLVVTSEEVRAWPLTGADGEPLATDQLVRDVTQMLQAMNFTARQMLQQYDSTGSLDATWQQTLADYYARLIPAEIQAEVAAAKTLVIVPDHVLHYFPFAALVTEVDPHQPTGFEMVMPKFLVEQGMSIVYAPSLGTWALLRDRGQQPIRQVNAVGIVEFESAPPLPGVELDLANLRSHFGDRIAGVAEGDQASKAEVSRLLASPGMLFAATHGMNYADDPLNSFLLCHAPDQTGGELTAGEIFAQEVGAELVVLSACFTGLADRSPLPGDDLFGLQRALLSSGGNAVVSGLWDVYDGTGPLVMNQFFGELKQGKPVAAALADAQRAFLRERRAGGRGEVWMHPYFWSVYTASGSDLVRFADPPNKE